MIDTHCHLLPGLDDGPRNMIEAVALARQLVEVGVGAVICTPHYSRRYPTSHVLACDRAQELRRALASVGVTLRLAVAAELAPAAALEASPEDLASRDFGSGQVLVELEPDTPAGFLDLLLERFEPLGLVPVLAHPERCRAVRSSPRLLDDARSRGALVQVVASSVVGRRGEEVAKAAWQLLESGRADLLASDAHRARAGGPYLGAAIKLIVARSGAETVQRLLEEAPAQLLRTPPESR